MPSSVAAAAGSKILVSGGDLPFGFGTFFHEYRLDGVLVDVSVLDVLPTRVASVYFFYDPELRHTVRDAHLNGTRHTSTDTMAATRTVPEGSCPSACCRSISKIRSSAGA